MPITRNKSRAATTSARKSGLVKGAAGRDRIGKELQKSKEKAAARQAQYNAPRRFWMPPSSERNIILLDREPWAFRYEHALMNNESGKRDFFVPCLQENEDCPACHVDEKEGTYIMYLSVLDLEPWTTRKGVLVEYTRRLYPVKARQQNNFKRKYDALVERGRDLRGCKVKLYRDDDRSPVIGNEFEWTGRVSEAKLERYKNEYQDRKGKTHVEDLGQPFNYEELFPEVSRKDLAIMVGHDVPVPGSQEESQKAADEDVDGWDDTGSEDAPWDDGPRTKARVKRTKAKTTKAKTTTRRRTRARA